MTTLNLQTEKEARDTSQLSVHYIFSLNQVVVIALSGDSQPQKLSDAWSVRDHIDDMRSHSDGPLECWPEIKLSAIAIL
jgi:hypothetical protein